MVSQQKKQEMIQDAEKRRVREQIPAQPVVPVGPITIEQKVAALQDEIASMRNDIANILGMLGRREQITPAKHLTNGHGCLIGEEEWNEDLHQCVKIAKPTPTETVQEQVMSQEECLARGGTWDSETSICKLPKSARTQESRRERRRRHLGTHR